MCDICEGERDEGNEESEVRLFPNDCCCCPFARDVLVSVVLRVMLGRTILAVAMVGTVAGSPGTTALPTPEDLGLDQVRQGWDMRDVGRGQSIQVQSIARQAVCPMRRGFLGGGAKGAGKQVARLGQPPDKSLSLSAGAAVRGASARRSDENQFSGLAKRACLTSMRGRAEERDMICHDVWECKTGGARWCRPPRTAQKSHTRLLDTCKLSSSRQARFSSFLLLSD